MRIPRSILLWPETSCVHLFWRCHNREFYLSDATNRDLYMQCIDDALKYKDQGENLEIHAFCVMNNHFHQAVSYKDGWQSLSKFMRYANSLFGARYNRRYDRSGKVAEGRPKTPRVQDDYHSMRLQFYIEANPIRAKFKTLANLKNYIYSSYGFYAYGIRSKFTHMLTIPKWYLNLGKTFQERQAKYRRLFARYIGELEKEACNFQKQSIGETLWIEQFKEEVRLRSKTCFDFQKSQQSNQDPSNTS